MKWVLICCPAWQGLNQRHSGFWLHLLLTSSMREARCIQVLLLRNLTMVSQGQKLRHGWAGSSALGEKQGVSQDCDLIGGLGGPPGLSGLWAAFTPLGCNTEAPILLAVSAQRPPVMPGRVVPPRQFTTWCSPPSRPWQDLSDASSSFKGSSD